DALVAHFIDTTAQRTLEAQFAQAQKMQAMGQLAGGVAHDFNNLLTAMIGFCDLLLQRHGAGDPSFADIMQIKQNANRAANLVRQLLAFSRKQPLAPRLLDVTDALTEMHHLLRRLLGERIQLDIKHGRDAGMVRVDPGQFDQVIINLAVNARDAMTEQAGDTGGKPSRLELRTRSERVDKPFTRGPEQVPAGDYTVIAVADTGAGIPRENLGRIFEPFFSTKTGAVGTGTGLGLSTVYGIIRQTGGFIFVDSVLGKGTEFTIYLPRSEATAEPAATRPVSAAKPGGEPSDADLTGGGLIMLVEDEDPVRVFAARALRNKGYTVIEARTGEGALDLLAEHAHIDVLITDMVMPGLNGAELTRAVRRDRPDLPVILISGYSEEAARGEITDSADMHFLPKPFSLQQLAAKVKEVMSVGA
ncbi:MAG: response regulator, partial [Rhodospirillaceae bacterium]